MGGELKRVLEGLVRCEFVFALLPIFEYTKMFSQQYARISRTDVSLPASFSWLSKRGVDGDR